MAWIDTSWYWGGGAVAATTLAALAARAMFSPRSQWLGPVVFRGSCADPPRIALTFDDGPDARSTPPILDVLGEHGVKAAFFVIGLNAQRHPELVERMHREGHVVGNHSFHHARLGTLRRMRYWQAELSRTDAVIESIIARQPRFFRPPMGFRNIHLARAVRQRQYLTTTWTRRALDTFHASAPRILERLVPRVRPGDIIALHDGREPGRNRNLQATIEALPRLIEGVRRHLSLVRLDELINGGAYRSPPEVPTSDAAAATGGG